MGKTIFETLVGAIVLVVAVFFLVTAYKGGTVEEKDSYDLYAKFDRVDGLRVNSDVRVSGMVVGKVVQQSIEPATYLAKVDFSVDKEVKLPVDTSAEIISAGLLGDKYLALIPGGADEYLKPGEQITITQSAISLESLIGKFVFGPDKEKEEDPAKQDAPAANTSPAGKAPNDEPKDEGDVFGPAF